MKNTLCFTYKTHCRTRYLSFFLILFAGILHANSDVVHFKNGDRLTGEVKSLQRGELRFKTDATDTISIEWDDVAYLSSDQNIQVETEDGIRYLGHLSAPQEESTVVVETAGGPIVLEAVRVVLMTPIEEQGVSRLDGDVTAGYDFTKASNVTQLNLGVDLNFRTETRILGIKLDSTVSDSDVNESSVAETLETSYTRLLKNRWFLSGNVSLERNDLQDLNLRTSVGGGGGRFLKQTNSMILALHGGLQQSRENNANIESDLDSTEAYFALEWDWFLNDSPELDLSTSLEIIPSLTESGRVRGEFEIALKWEMISDLFWQLSLKDSYDNRPAAGTGGAEKNDYTINSSLGWEF